MNNFAQLSPVAKSEIKSSPLVATGLLTGALLVIAFAIAIYLDSTSPGVTPEQIAFMVVFP